MAARPDLWCSSFDWTETSARPSGNVSFQHRPKNKLFQLSSERMEHQTLRVFSLFTSYGFFRFLQVMKIEKEIKRSIFKKKQPVITLYMVRKKNCKYIIYKNTFFVQNVYKMIKVLTVCTTRLVLRC